MRWEKSTNSCVHIQNFSIIVFSLNNFYGYKSSTKLVGFQILAGYEAIVITCLIHAKDTRKSDKRLRKINKKTHNILLETYPQLSMTHHDKVSTNFMTSFFLQLELEFTGGPLDSRSMCDCPSQSPSPEKPGGHQPSQPAPPTYQTRVTHTKLTKLENKKQHGTIQNQFRCI